MCDKSLPIDRASPLREEGIREIRGSSTKIDVSASVRRENGRIGEPRERCSFARP
jgi:hypothetical protein